MAKKKRLDLMVVERGLAASRQRAKSLIMTGRILVNHRPHDKPGTLISPDDEILLKGEDLPYVSRGGLKLKAALENFSIDPHDLVCLDAGASTGGFTDCLLQHGARRVFAVDVGYGQLAWTLRQDPRVVVIERTNIRHMTAASVPDPVDLAVIDVSFISLTIVVPSVLKFLKKEGGIVALIKPQFEVGRENVGKGGVVRDPALHRQVVDTLSRFFTEMDLTPIHTIPSPIRGPKGNREFLTHLRFHSG